MNGILSVNDTEPLTVVTANLPFFMTSTWIPHRDLKLPMTIMKDITICHVAKARKLCNSITPPLFYGHILSNTKCCQYYLLHISQMFIFLLHHHNYARQSCRYLYLFNPIYYQLGRKNSLIKIPL